MKRCNPNCEQSNFKQRQSMIKASRNIQMNLRSIMILIAFAAVMLSVCIVPASAISPTDITFGQPTASFTVVSGNNATTPSGSLVPDIQKDDNFTKVIINDTIEDGLNINGTIYNSVYVGSNGYLTFGHGSSTFNPLGIPGYTNGPMIAAMFTDIDVSKGGDIYMYEDDLNDTVSVTWKDVAPFTAPSAGGGSGFNTFQILLHGLGNGDFGIELRYENISWCRSGSSKNATGGWTFGDQLTYGEVNDSGTVEFLTVENESNIGHPGVFVWEVYDGGVQEVDLNISENSPGGTVIGPLTADDDTPLELNFTLLNDDGGNFEIFNDSGVYKVRVKSGATLDYETSPNHIRQINVQAEDPDTNTGSAWLNITLTDVNEAPAASGAFISPTSGQIIKGGESMTVRWENSTDPEGDVVKYDLWYFNGTWAHIGNLLSNNSTAYALPADDTSSAKFRVYANDTALNSSATEITFTLDTTSPVATFVSPTPSDNSNLSQNYINVNVTVTEINLKNVTTYIYNGTSLVDSNISTSSPLVYNFTGLDDGTYYINATAYDDAGNLNVTVTRTILLDTNAPVSPTITVPTNGATLNTSTTWVNGTISADTTNVTVYVNGTATNTSVAVSGTTYSIANVPLGADGSHEINVSAMDSAGNVNTTNATAIVTVDTTSPTAPTDLVHTDADASNDNYDNDNSTDISWSASIDVSTVTYRVYRDGVLNGSTSLLLYTFTNETEGSHTYNVSAIDSVGNINTTNASVTVIVDYTDPVIHNLSLSDTSPSYGQAIIVTVNVTDTNLASVSAGSTSLTHQSGALWNGTIIAGYGTSIVTVTAYDNASNSATNTSLSYTGPAVPTTSSSGGGNLPTPLPENVVNNEVKGTVFNEPVTSADLNFNMGYITLVTVDAKGTISEVMITIQKLVDKPSEIKVTPPSGAVHTYHNIELGRIENSDLAGATIKFRAEKKWIADNGGDKNAVVVMRYHDSWVALETKPIGEDDEYVFFSARTPGFSTFAITMQLEEEVVPVEVQTPEPVIEEVEDEPLPEPEEEKSYWWLILVMAAIVIVSVAVFVYRNKKDESEE